MEKVHFELSVRLTSLDRQKKSPQVRVNRCIAIFLTRLRIFGLRLIVDRPSLPAAKALSELGENLDQVEGSDF